MSNTIVISKQLNDNILVTNAGAKYVLSQNLRTFLPLGADKVQIRNMSGSLIDTLSPIDVEKLVLKDGSEVFISDIDTLFTELVDNFFFDTQVDRTGTLVFPYRADISNITPPPSDRFLQWNNAIQQNATQIFVSDFNDDFQDIENLLLLVKPNDRIIIFDSSNSNNFQDWRVTQIIDNSGYVTYNVTLLESTTTFTTNNQRVTLTLLVSAAFSAYASQADLLSSVSTTSLVSVNVLTLNFIPDEPGKFKIFFMMLWTLSSIGQAAIFEICLNNTVMFTYRMEPSDMGNRDILTLDHDFDLVAGNNILELRFFKSLGMAVLTAEEASISAIRLP